MNDKYAIRFLMDDEYELVEKSTGKQVMTGSLQEINAYLDLEAKGFDI